MREENTVTLPRKISPKEYADLMKYEKLSKKELKKGKKVKIYGSDEPLPFDEAYAMIQMGLPYEDIESKYGQMRKIVLFAILDGIKYEPAIANMFDKEVENRRIQKAVAQVNPVVVNTMQEAVNEYCPDIRKEITVFASQLVQKAIKGINAEDATSTDTLNYAKAVQVASDTIEVTQRHSAGVNISGAASVQVQGFEFVLDAPPETVEEAIEAVIDEKEDESDG